MRIVSAADWSHADSLLQFIASVQQTEPASDLVIYDLGMTSVQRAQVQSRMGNGRLETFEYERYPAFFNISVAAGEYAWKPTIIGSELSAADTPLCWMDAGNVIVRPLHLIRYAVARSGFFALRSNGNVPDWTHPSMLRYFDLPLNWGSGFANLAANCVAFDPLRPSARKLAQDWAKYALIQDAIAPAGSSRENHRQDQALLTVLAYKNGAIRRPTSRWFWRGPEFESHRDIIPDESTRAGRPLPASMEEMKIRQPDS